MDVHLYTLHISGGHIGRPDLVGVSQKSEFRVRGILFCSPAVMNFWTIKRYARTEGEVLAAKSPQNAFPRSPFGPIANREFSVFGTRISYSG